MIFKRNEHREINPDTPKWFMEWLLNDFTHLTSDVWWLKLLTITGLTAIIGAVIAYLFKA
jgi:hypothetical protein